MAWDANILDKPAKALECTAGEFILGTTNTVDNNSREKMDEQPLMPYVLLASGSVLLGAGFWISASISFAAYVILSARLLDTTLKRNILLPSELAPTGRDEKSAYTGRF